MSEGFPYADIVILALIAGFILLRLRSILGSKGDDEKPGYFNRAGASPAMQEPVIKLDEKSLKLKPREEDDPYLASLTDNDISQALESIRAKDPQFSATAFLQGARMAFEMVFDAFAKGDKQTLGMLLSPSILSHFTQDIDRRTREEGGKETTLVSVKPKDIVHASLNGTMARLSVHFTSEQVTVERDGKGAIVSGDPSHIQPVEDEWTFERDVTSKNPNWQIVET